MRLPILFAILAQALSQSCTRQSNGHRIIGVTPKATLFRISQEECLSKCADDVTSKSCKAAYYYQYRKSNAEKYRPICLLYAANSMSRGVSVVRSKAYQRKSVLYEVMRPCSAAKIQSLTDLSFHENDDSIRPSPRVFADWGPWGACSAECGATGFRFGHYPTLEQRVACLSRVCAANCSGGLSTVQRQDEACSGSCSSARTPPSSAVKSAAQTRVRDTAPAMLGNGQYAPSGQPKSYGAGGQAQPRPQPQPQPQTYQPRAQPQPQPQYRPQPQPRAQPQPQTYQPRAQPQAQPRPQPQTYAKPNVAQQQPNAQWGPWGAWSTCPSGYGCKGAQMIRSRQPQTYGTPQGERTQSKPCVCQQAAPAPSWQPWARWGSCSKTCGEGVRTRSRFCQGGQCVGSAVSSSPCNMGPCPTWKAWSSYGACSATCGSGQRERTRACTHGTACNGNGVMTDNCPDIQPCPRPADWSPWSDCNKSCGSGQRQRVRTCQYGTAGQSGCDMAMSEKGNCPSLPPCAIWTAWAPWGSCSVSCGSGGVQNRNRNCQYGTAGRDCQGSSEDQRTCNPAPQPCATWSPWRAWGPCTKTCGGGVQERLRTCQGGGNCRGPAEETKRCSEQACPQWEGWQPWERCSVTCGTGSYQRQRSCTYAQCETGAPNDSGQCQAGPCPTPAPRAPTQRPAPACSWTQWTSYGSCSVTCGTGQQSRTRLCSCYGGCPTSNGMGKVSTQSCAMGPCGGYAAVAQAQTQQGYQRRLVGQRTQRARKQN